MTKIDAATILDELHDLMLSDVTAYRRRIAHLYTEAPEVFEAVVNQHKVDLEEAAREGDLESLQFMPPDEREHVLQKLAKPDGYKRRYSSIEGMIALRPKEYAKSVARIRLSSMPPSTTRKKALGE
jgi:hypothetical protein